MWAEQDEGKHEGGLDGAPPLGNLLLLLVLPLPVSLGLELPCSCNIDPVPIVLFDLQPLDNLLLSKGNPLS